MGFLKVQPSTINRRPLPEKREPTSVVGIDLPAVQRPAVALRRFDCHRLIGFRRLVLIGLHVFVFHQPGRLSAARAVKLKRVKLVGDSQDDEVRRRSIETCFATLRTERVKTGVSNFLQN